MVETLAGKGKVWAGLRDWGSIFGFQGGPDCRNMGLGWTSWARALAAPDPTSHVGVWQTTQTAGRVDRSQDSTGISNEEDYSDGRELGFIVRHGSLPFHFLFSFPLFFFPGQEVMKGAVIKSSQVLVGVLVLGAGVSSQ